MLVYVAMYMYACVAIHYTTSFRDSFSFYLMIDFCNKPLAGWTIIPAYMICAILSSYS